MSAFCAKGLGLDPLPSIAFPNELLSTPSAASIICCICSTYYPLQMQGCLWLFFHMVNQRLCSSTVSCARWDEENNDDSFVKTPKGGWGASWPPRPPPPLPGSAPENDTFYGEKYWYFHLKKPEIRTVSIFWMNNVTSVHFNYYAQIKHTVCACLNTEWSFRVRKVISA